MEQKLKALIVDDEEKARNLLIKLLEDLHFFNEIRVARSSAIANQELSQYNPDIIFLDIKMPGKDGFSLINDLDHRESKPKIVFVTAHDQYAIKAIKKDAFDYLLKPVSRKELKQCVQRFIDNRNNFQLSAKKQSLRDEIHQLSKIKINTRSGALFINPSAIFYCKADGNYTTICTGEKKHLCSMSIGKVKELLSGNEFVRAGRSHIINTEYITLLDRRECLVTLDHNNEVVKVKIPKQHLRNLTRG